MADKVRFGIIGSAGLIGNYHSNILRKGEGPYELAALCDIDEERVQAQSQAWGLPAYTDVQEFLQKAEMDAVIVGTPTPLHAEQGIAVVNSGRHLLAEKPIAHTIGAARKLVAAIKKSGKMAVMHYQQRGSPTFLKAKQMIDSGELGKLLFVRATGSYYKTDYYYTLGGWRGLWGKEGGACCINQAPHDIDILCWLAAGSAPAEMSARWRSLFHPTIQCEDSASAIGCFPNGVEFTLQVSVATHADPARFEIFGSAGDLTISGGKFTRYVRYEMDSIEFARTYAGNNPYATPKVVEQPLPEVPPFDPSATHKRFAEAILKNDRSLLLCPADQGLWSMEVINGVYYSNALGKKIKFPLSATAYEKAYKTWVAKAKMPKRITQKADTGIMATTNEKQQGHNLKKDQEKK